MGLPSEMPKNLDLIVSWASFLPQVMSGMTNMRTTQNFHNTRALIVVFIRKTEKLQGRMLKKKALFCCFPFYFQ